MSYRWPRPPCHLSVLHKHASQLISIVSQSIPYNQLIEDKLNLRPGLWWVGLMFWCELKCTRAYSGAYSAVALKDCERGSFPVGRASSSISFWRREKWSEAKVYMDSWAVTMAGQVVQVLEGPTLGNQGQGGLGEKPVNESMGLWIYGSMDLWIYKPSEGARNESRGEDWSPIVWFSVH